MFVNLHKLFGIERLRQSQLLQNLISVGGANILSRLVGLLVLGYPARVLGPDNYGLVGFGLSITAYSSILLTPGLVTWGTREIARNQGNAGEILVSVRVIQVVLALVAYISLAVYAYTYVHSANERVVVLLCGLSMFNSALSVDWVFNGLEMMRYPAWIAVATSVLSAAGLLLFVRDATDLYVYALLPPLVGAIGVLTGYVLILRKITLVKPSLAAVRVAIVAAIPLGVTMALVVILHYANNLIVRAFLGVGALGIFLAAFRLFELVATLPSLVSVVFLPRLSRLVVSDRIRARCEARRYAEVLVLVGAFVAAAMWGEAYWVVDTLYGPRYHGAVNIVRAMAVAVLFNFAICGYTNGLIAFGKDKVMIVVVVISAVVSVGGGFILVPHFGVLGAGVVVAGIDLAGWLVSVPYYRDSIGSLSGRAWLTPIFGGLTVVTLTLWLQLIGAPIWVRMPTLVLVYGVIVLKNIKMLRSIYSHAHSTKLLEAG